MPHGPRSTFRDWAAERTDYPRYLRDMAEIALAHDVGSEIEQAHRRSEMLEKHREMSLAGCRSLTAVLIAVEISQLTVDDIGRNRAQILVVDVVSSPLPSS